MIVLKNISKKYRSFAVLDGVSASLPEGKITAFIGGNGAGKTTLLTALAGAGRWKGNLWVQGKEPWK